MSYSKFEIVWIIFTEISQRVLRLQSRKWSGKFKVKDVLELNFSFWSCEYTEPFVGCWVWVVKKGEEGEGRWSGRRERGGRVIMSSTWKIHQVDLILTIFHIAVESLWYGHQCEKQPSHVIGVLHVIGVVPCYCYV